MTREDLFKAIGMMDEERLAKSAKYRNTPEDVPMEETKVKTYNGYAYGTERRKTKKLWMLAAVIECHVRKRVSLTVSSESSLLSSIRFAT